VALEPAGVSLQAENFNKYIKQLDSIDKAQQDIFDVDSKGLTRSFNNASKAADKYEKELKQVEQANKRVTQSQKQFTQGLQGAAAGLAAFATGAVVQFGAESAKLAAQFKGQQIGLDNLAASFGQSGNEIQSAIQTASKGTISGLDAIQAANTALLFGVAKTPEEFSTLTDSALTLGRTLGLNATQSIEQFTTALGRQSLLILDNFGISAKQVNAEIERLAQADFGKARSELTEAQKQATFMKAALNIAGKAAATIGDEAGKAQAGFDRLTAAGENLQVTFGTLVQPLGVGISDVLTRAAKTAQQFFAFLGAGFTGVGKIASGVFDNVINTIEGGIQKTKQLFATGDLGILFEPVTEDIKSFDTILDEAGTAAIDRFKEIASTIEGVSFPDDELKQFNDEFGNQDDIIDDATQSLEAYQSALQQAEQLQLSFARQAEDSALKLARANEDVARKQAKQVSDLEQSQAKDRDKLLNDQVKQLDKFEADRRKQITKAERDISKARKAAADQQKRDQEKLQRELQRAQEQFNLSQLQSERRFGLQSQRLRAEGDILALQQLKEDRALEQQEEKENFSLSQKERKQSGEEQQRQQVQDLDAQLSELKANLEDQRAELLTSFDEQLLAQEQAQQEARIAQQQAFNEQAAERAIQLQREEEDRQLSQARQLEDLGRSFAEQEGVTIEGTTAIANQLGKVFGIDGTADSIISGFTTKTKGEFTDLFADIEKIVKDAEAAIEPEPIQVSASVGPSDFGGRIGGVQRFQDGGIVSGPVGSPQPAIVHGGETVLPTHRQSFTMTAPVIPSQSLNVNMSGGFDIRGGESAGGEATRQAITEMTDAFEIVVKRLGRQVS
jgi:hypothetical protein